MEKMKFREIKYCFQKPRPNIATQELDWRALFSDDVCSPWAMELVLFNQSLRRAIAVFGIPFRGSFKR